MSTGVDGENTPKEKGWYAKEGDKVSHWNGKKWGRTLQANKNETGPATHVTAVVAVLFLALSYLASFINSLYFYQKYGAGETSPFGDSAMLFAKGQYLYEILTLVLAIIGWVKGKATLPIIVLILLILVLPASTVLLIGISGT